MVAGIALILAGTVPFTWLGHGVPDVALAAALVVRGVGMAMIGAPVMNIVYSRIEPAHLPRASGALNLLNTVGGSVGTAALAVVLQDRLAARGPDVSGRSPTPSGGCSVSACSPPPGPRGCPVPT